MYRNIFFDLGNVLLHFKPLEYLMNKFADRDLAEEIHHQVFQSEEWLMLDRGTITEKEAIDRLAQKYGASEAFIREAFDSWMTILMPNTETVGIMKDLKEAGLRLFYLSNFHENAFQYVTDRYDFFSLFEGGIVSFKEKLLKPEEGIYGLLLDRYRLDPLESIFIDDSPENVEGAKKKKITAIHFSDASELREQLRAYHICI